MDYINCKEAAARWDISERRVRAFCSEKKIPGAIFMGKQWMIPKAAARPVDGRTKEAREAGPCDDYIFPVPLFSSDFGNKEILGEYGDRLLDIQLRYLDGNYTQGFILAKELQSDNPPGYILFGVYYTQLFFCMLLGLTEEFRWYYNRIDKIISKEVIHKEDYKLAFYSMLAHLSWDSQKFLSIDPEKLSPAALPLYQMTLSVIGIQSKQTELALKNMEATCYQARVNNLYPVEMTIEGNLIASYTALGNKNKAIKHTESFCELALRHGWVHYIAKWYNHTFTYINDFFNKRKPSEIPSLASASKQNVMNALLIRGAMFGPVKVPFAIGADFELVILISYGLSNKSIADIRGVSLEEIESQIRKLCEQVGCNDKKELTKALNNMLSLSFGLNNR